MGTDINFVVEERVSEPGNWRLAQRPGLERSDRLDWYDDRAYECFSLLTGLDFSQRHVRPVEPVAALRGWPTDLSADARARLIRGTDDTAFGRSWLDAQELRAFDWDSTVNWTYMTAAPDRRNVSPSERRRVQAHVEAHGRPPAGWTVAGWARDGFSVTGRITRRELAGRFLDVVDDMLLIASGDPAAVRCVFEFNR